MMDDLMLEERCKTDARFREIVNSIKNTHQRGFKRRIDYIRFANDWDITTADLRRKGFRLND